MTRQIQIRRWYPNFADENLLLPGEPLWDDELKRFGMFGGDGRIHWGPALNSARQIVPDGSGITGNAENAVEIVWNNNALIIQTRRGLRIASFAPSGTVFTNASVAGAYPAGTRNDVVNGGFQCARNTFTSGSVNNAGARQLLPAPNWLAWAGAAATSELAVDFVSDVAPVSGAARSLRCRVGGNGSPISAGIRTFVHDAAALRGVSTASVWLKGPVGAGAGLRLLTENGVARYDTLVGTGAWALYTLTTDVGGVGTPPGNWAAFDALYCPQANAAGRDWLVGPAEWNPGPQPAQLPLPGTLDEQPRVNNVYVETRIRALTMAWRLLAGYTRIVDAPGAVTEFDHTGATFETTGGQVCVARLPLINT